ncbi:hypothetical protein [Escherichia coli]|uniref:hypothetical protein n=1 Tax=Escherichia coli TaxID=562 RepID=UPI000E2D732C|nr:hypothetical protein [Escherichia coli]RDS02463.1 hypothetical protein C3997_01947 [Escherichia coli]
MDHYCTVRDSANRLKKLSTDQQIYEMSQHILKHMPRMKPAAVRRNAYSTGHLRTISALTDTGCTATTLGSTIPSVLNHRQPSEVSGAASVPHGILRNHLKSPDSVVFSHKITHQSSERGHVVSVIHINPQTNSFKKQQACNIVLSSCLIPCVVPPHGNISTGEGALFYVMQI